MTHGSLALKLRVLRAERALTIEQAAARAGVTPETISDAERGRRHPYLPTLRKLAAAYDVPVEELLAREAEEPEVALAGSTKDEAPGRTGPEDLAELLARLGSETRYLADPNLGSRVLEATNEEAKGIHEAAIAEALLLAPELERRLVIDHPNSADWVRTTVLWSTAAERLHAVRLALLAKGGAEAVPIELAQATYKLERVLTGVGA